MQVEKNDLQNEFFNNARTDRLTVNLFLRTGKRWVGRIRSCDTFTLLLEGEVGEQIIYKHAISTVGVAHSGSGNRGRTQGTPAREQPTS